MTLSYQATLDDIAEPAIRFFLRSKTARRYQARSTIFGAVIMAAAFAFIFRERSAAFLGWSALTGAIVGAAINFWTYIPSARKRIRRHIKTENGHRIPTETVFVINPGRLECMCLGVKIEFSLKDLEGISEDPNCIELSFGEKGLCTIPVRVFQDEKAKSEFIKEIEANRV